MGIYTEGSGLTVCPHTKIKSKEERHHRLASTGVMLKHIDFKTSCSAKPACIGYVGLCMAIQGYVGLCTAM